MLKNGALTSRAAYLQPSLTHKPQRCQSCRSRESPIICKLSHDKSEHIDMMLKSSKGSQIDSSLIALLHQLLGQVDINCSTQEGSAGGMHMVSGACGQMLSCAASYLLFQK